MAYTSFLIFAFFMVNPTPSKRKKIANPHHIV
jgi:hypothetical protein